MLEYTVQLRAPFIDAWPDPVKLSNLDLSDMTDFAAVVEAAGLDLSSTQHYSLTDNASAALEYHS